MCTIGCMYREQVDGLVATTTPLWRWSSLAGQTEVQQQQSTSPRRSRSRSACWYAKRARAAAEGGRHRDRDVQQHVHAGWLTGKMREGLHIGSCWLPRGMGGAGAGVTSQGCAAHHAWPAYTYSLSLLYLNLNLGPRQRMLHPCGFIRRPGLAGETLRQARKRRMVSGKW